MNKYRRMINKKQNKSQRLIETLEIHMFGAN
jgi:hypothetical protein